MTKPELERDVVSLSMQLMNAADLLQGDPTLSQIQVLAHAMRQRGRRSLEAVGADVPPPRIAH